jgi:hypothetical protein
MIKKVTKEAFWWATYWILKILLTKRKKHQINSYFKDIISTVNESMNFTFFDLQKQNKISAKINGSKLKQLKRRIV